MKQLLLASTSPRRAEIMRYFSLPFDQAAPLYCEEENRSPSENPSEFTSYTATQKAQSLREAYSQHIIVASDTVVYSEGIMFHKPKSDEEGFRTLKTLSGKPHEVYSAISIICENREYSGVEKTTVYMNALTDKQIRTYQKELHCADKAGGYAIQGSGGLIVNRIEGCYYNVMGFPINTLHTLLLNVGIDLWDYLGA